MSCTHTIEEIDIWLGRHAISFIASGTCPICLRAENEKLIQEIDRLRAMTGRYQEGYDRGHKKGMADCDAEIERLRAEIEKLHAERVALIFGPTSGPDSRYG